MADQSAIADVVAPAPDRRSWITFPRVAAVLGGTLLVAAAAKTQHQLTEPFAESGIAHSRWLVFLGVHAELLIGLWLLSGLYTRLARWCAGALFLTFAGFSLWQILNGEVSCGCFGSIPVRPWFTFALDVSAVVALACIAPRHNYTLHEHSTLFIAFVCISVLAVLLTSLPFWVHPAPSALSLEPPQVQLGDIMAGGRATATFLVANTGPIPVKVETIQSTCDCFHLTLAQATIAPGESVQATATLDLKEETTFSGALRIEFTGLTPHGQRAFHSIAYARVAPQR